MNFDQQNIKLKLSKVQILTKISDLAESSNTKLFAVGGYVRDLFLNRKSKDIDIVVLGSGIAFAENFCQVLGKNARLSVFQNFGTANIKYKNFEIEFVGARKESYRSNSRKPIVEEGTLSDDLSRRDFTINALAASLNKSTFGEITDLFNGLSDLKNKIIRTPLDPETTYSDDPLRMMRAIRFASQLNFRLEEKTYDSIKLNAHRLSIISQERITDELNKIILSNKPSTGFKLLEETNLLDQFFPEMLDLKGTETVENKTHKDNFNHTLQVLDNICEVSDNLWLRWATILHDIGKPKTKKFDPAIGWTFHAHELVGSKMVNQIFTNLKLPQNEKMRYVKKLVFLHLRPVALTKDDVTDSAIRRLIVDAGDDIDDLMMLCKADVTSKNDEKVKLYKQRFEEVGEKIKSVEEKDRLRNWKNPITGEIIMETFGIEPSKEIGIIKEIIKEAIMEGEIHNSYEEAFKLLIKTGKMRGLNPIVNENPPKITIH